MNKLLANFRQFSSLIIPYSPRGFYKPEVDRYLNELLTKAGIDVQGFVFAFQSVLESIGKEDQNLFLNSVCDNDIARGFREGIDELQIKGKPVQNMIIDEIQEDAFFGSAFLVERYEKDIPFYQQKLLSEKVFADMQLIRLDNSYESAIFTLGINVYIRIKMQLFWEGVKFNRDAYHIVQFLAVNQNQIQLFPITKVIFHPEKLYEMLLQEGHEWTIVNIDEYSKFKKSN